MKLAFRCPVNRAREARITPELRLWYGQDLFYFSDAAAMARFRKDPLRYAKRLTDPVAHLRFEPSTASPRTRHNGRDYLFRSTSTLRMFRANPDSFATRKGYRM